jgi:glycosyltransferase involved in cell wall biosynthesis
MYEFMLPHLKNRYGKRKDVFIPFAIPTDRYKPIKVKRNSDGLLFFHPTRFDKTVKGTDKLLKAFNLFIMAGYRAKLRISDWGWEEDATRAKAYVEAKDLTKYIEVVQPCAKPTLIRRYNEADLVLDQFNIGSGGSTLPEAMSCEKPVCIYLNNWNMKCFGEMQPVLNASNVEGILNSMINATDPTLRRRLGKLGREFVLKHYEQKTVALQLIKLYEALKGGMRDNFHLLYGKDVIT